MNIEERIKYNFKTAVNSGRVPHAILIEGGFESRRHEVAWFFAQTIVCAEKEKPCDTCKHCEKVKDRTHPDIIEIKGGEGARSFHIDEIRKLKSNAYVLPNEADKKVFLLINAQNMSEQAQNALLKVLEEPPEHAIIILTCDSRISLLSTVLSRIVAFDLGPVEDDNVTDEKKIKAREIASEFILSLNEINELEVLKVTGKLEKEKFLFSLCVEEILLAVRDALRIKNNSKDAISSLNEESRTLAINFTIDQLVSMVSVLNELKDAADKNVNNGIMITRLCSEIRRASGR